MADAKCRYPGEWGLLWEAIRSSPEDHLGHVAIRDRIIATKREALVRLGVEPARAEKLAELPLDDLGDVLADEVEDGAITIH